LKTSHEELFDLVSLTNADLETTMNTAKHALSLLCDPKGKFQSCHHDPYMLLIRSCKKSDDIIPVKRTGSRPLFPFYQPNSKDDLTDIRIRKL
jgi:mRNA-degrading endonuclease YafQ of YafQ-DinJ toxin-antitoxin module